MGAHGSFFFYKYSRIFHNRLDYVSRCGNFRESRKVPRLAPVDYREHSQKDTEMKDSKKLAVETIALTIAETAKLKALAAKALTLVNSAIKSTNDAARLVHEAFGVYSKAGKRSVGGFYATWSEVMDASQREVFTKGRISQLSRQGRMLEAFPTLKNERQGRALAASLKQSDIAPCTPKALQVVEAAGGVVEYLKANPAPVIVRETAGDAKPATITAGAKEDPFKLLDTTFNAIVGVIARDGSQLEAMAEQLSAYAKTLRNMAASMAKADAKADAKGGAKAGK